MPHLSKRDIKEAHQVSSGFDSLPFEQQLTLVLQANAKEKQNLVLSWHRSRELVQALPDEELFFTTEEIGEEMAFNS